MSQRGRGMTKGPHSGTFVGAVCALGLAFALAPSAASAATITPDTTADDFGSDMSHCSLREAIQAANTNGVFGGCTASDNSADTIVLQSGQTYVRSITGVDDLNVEGDLDVNDEPLTIQSSGGVGAPATIDANHIDRVIDVGPNASPSSLTLSNLVL